VQYLECKKADLKTVPLSKEAWYNKLCERMMSMALLLSLLTPLLTLGLFLMVWRFGSVIHHHENTLYVLTALIAVGLSVISVLIQLGQMGMPTDLIYALFFQGQLGLSFYLLVMFAGALKPKSKSQIALLRVRRELAVLGFLWLVPHATLLIVRALSALNPTGTLAFFIIIPLVITSFPVIRRLMTPSTWRGFHYWAYIVYGLIYFHLASITLLVQWNDGTAYGELAWLRLFIYTAIFVSYLTLKQKYYAPVKKSALS
jgi:DMSO/TMAO reductase YedYZ heme-binding membrane subunit